jgi:hypothetical protein
VPFGQWRMPWPQQSESAWHGPLAPEQLPASEVDASECASDLFASDASEAESDGVVASSMGDASGSAPSMAPSGPGDVPSCDASAGACASSSDASGEVPGESSEPQAALVAEIKITAKVAPRSRSFEVIRNV